MNKLSSNVEMQRFNAALQKVVSVSKSDLQKMLAEDKANKVGKRKPGPRPKSSASGPVLSAQD